MAFPYVANPTWADDAIGGTEIDAAALNQLEAGVKLAGVQGLAATPPASPVDGMLWRYPADASAGVYWWFQYLASATDWLFAGGPALFAEVVTSQTTASASYTDLATVGPAIAIPFAGDYDVEIGARMSNANDTAGTFMSYAIGGTGAVDADAIVNYSGASVSSGVTVRVNEARLRRKTGLTAVTLTAKYKADAGTGHFLDRWMKVTPVRLT